SKSKAAALVVATALLIAAPLAVLAADRFQDVPDSNIFHEDIAWLADGGVTLGCNPPDNDEFCPTDNVTRQQMAAFMHRLAENRVVDAGTLEGHAAADLTPDLSYGAGLDSVEFSGFDVITVRSVTVDAPDSTGGAVVAEGYGDIVGNGSTVDDARSFACWISDDPNSTSSNEGAHVSVAQGTTISQNVFATNFATSTALELEAGESASLHLLCRDTAGGTGNLFRVSNAQLSAMFLPGEGHTIEITEP
ncbi:MAG: S-layer homology domain-containing protein, partial [Actinomycetota bacterium]